MTFSVSPRAVGRALAWCIGLLLLGQVGRLVAGRGSFLDMDTEQSLPTWFSVLLLALSALLLAGLALRSGRRGERSRPDWWMLSALFFFLSMDEQVSFHERLIPHLRGRIGDAGGWLYFAWVIPYGCLAIAVAFCSQRVLRELSPRNRRRFLVAGALYVGGALGVEVLEGRWAWAHGDRSLGFALLATLEETLEMVGVGVFVHALVDILATERVGLRLVREDPLPADEPGVRSAAA